MARGVTLLESVMGVAMLALVAASLTGVTGVLIRSAERQRALLGAAELANRLMIILNDDPRNLPTAGVPFEFLGRSYRWSMTRRGIVVEPSRAYVEYRRGRAGGVPLERQFEAVDIEVWLAEGSGGSFSPVDGVPRASVSRLIGSLSLRNPDSAERRLSGPDGLNRAIQQLFQQIGSEAGPIGTTTTTQQPAGGGGGGGGG